MQEENNSDISYRWNLNDLFATEQAWAGERDALTAEVGALGAFQGQLHQSAGFLADALDTVFAFQQRLAKVRIYASLLADEDTRNPHSQGMERETIRLISEFGTRTSYMRPEILKMGRPLIDRFLAEEPRLEIYRQILDDIVRRAEHTLSESEEQILAAAAPLSGSPQSIYNVLTNADFQYPSLRLSDGKEVVLTMPAYENLRRSGNRDDRRMTMETFFGALGQFSSTFGTTLDGSVQKALFYTRCRRFESALEMSLFGPNIPTAVYSRLIEGVNRHLPTLHRYLRLRQGMLGVDRLHYYDLYAPLVPSADQTYTPAQTRDLIVTALSPLGDEYASVLARAFDERWMDWYPRPGKRSGAYNNGSAYGVHPYVLLNFNGRFNDVSTVAHELGHSLHSHYSNTRQPYPTSGYPIFIAEVASIFNEILLMDHMLRTTTDTDLRLSLLIERVERLRTTLFRQVQFADFELRLHQMAGRGESITGDSVSRLYLDLTRAYYGHDQGITEVDDYIRHEWSLVSHFYREFYVYQYATSLTAAEALAREVRQGVSDAADRYLALISAGSSGYPIDLLRKAGVDMTTEAPLEATIAEMDAVLGEVERLVG